MPAKPNTVQSSSWGPILDITADKGNVVLDAAAKAGHKVTRVYGFNSTPDHNNRRCVDLMTYGNKAMADWLVDFLKDNDDALGVEGIIFNRRVMGFPENGPAYRGPSASWRSYGGQNPHTDHVHVQFNTKAIGKVVGGSGKGGGEPASQDAKRRGNSGWYGDLWVVGKVKAYDGTGKHRPEHDLKPGVKKEGVVDANPFGDGRYFRVGNKPHALWYPLDSGDWSHDKGGAPIGGEGR